MRLDPRALLTLLVCAGCGGSIADGSDLGNPNGRAGDNGSVGVDPTQTDRVAVLRTRCAEPWKSAFASDLPPTAALLEGRWLRCPSDGAHADPRALVVTFDAFELGADGRFYRLAVGPGGFERQTTGLGDTGSWMMSRDGEVSFELPACSEGHVTVGRITKCGGLDVVVPMLETSPTRMRFYGEPFSYVKDE
jgi:hypothetical protein